MQWFCGEVHQGNSAWFLKCSSSCSCSSLHIYVIVSDVQTQHVSLEALGSMVASIACSFFLIIGFSFFATKSLNKRETERESCSKDSLYWTAHPHNSKLHAPRPHPSVLKASFLWTSTWFYVLSPRLANSCVRIQTQGVAIADHFTGITGTSVRKME